MRISIANVVSDYGLFNIPCGSVRRVFLEGVRCRISIANVVSDYGSDLTGALSESVLGVRKLSNLRRVAVSAPSFFLAPLILR